ncbi:MAG TPA: DUF881 domain-containing protein [Candidatus Nitrosotalea sp.]|nr:DUF881 domain-containing protein [Candidatus Nitrosotalea sp.]
MDPRRPAIYVLALLAIGFGFLITAQWRSQLIVPADRVAQNQALVASAQSLARQNSADRSQVANLRAKLDRLEAQAAQGSSAAARLSATVQELRVEAGATPLRGPGVTVRLADGKPGPDLQGATAWIVTYEDVQDVVNVLFQGGAEGVAVNGHRITPRSSFQGTGGAVIIGQSPPLLAPFEISGVGDRSGIQALLAQNGVLGDLRLRQRLYGVGLDWTGAANLTLPATDSSLEVTYAHTP